MFVLLLLVGVVISGYLLSKGIREDYEEYVRGVILQSGDLKRILFPGV